MPAAPDHPSEVPAHVPADVPGAVADPVAHWQQQLAARDGASEVERRGLLAELRRFCTERRTAPGRLLATWRDHPDLADGAASHRAVASFLLHNGVDVLAEPGPEDGAARGPVPEAG